MPKGKYQRTKPSWNKGMPRHDKLGDGNHVPRFADSLKPKKITYDSLGRPLNQPYKKLLEKAGYPKVNKFYE